MKIWWCLFKKEFRIMRSFLIANGLALVAAGIIGAYFAYRYYAGMSSFFLFIAMIWHFFYLLLYLLVSLKAEQNNAPIWLQSPQNGWVLLSAKFSAGLMMMYASLNLNLLIWSWVVHLDFRTGLFQGANDLHFLLPIAGLIKQHWILLVLVFTQRALLLTALGVFIYFFEDTLKNTLKGWRWIFCLILFIATICLIRLFSDTIAYDTLFHWGQLDFSDFSALISSKPDSDPQFSQILRNLFGRPFYCGDLVYGFVLTAIWFYAAGWLLDRKVEV